MPRGVLRAVRQPQRAQETQERCAANLLRVVESLGEAAVDTYRRGLAAELLERHYPRDLALLREALMRLPASSISRELTTGRVLIDSMLRWLEERLDVTRYLLPDQELDVPAGKLDGYELDGGGPAEGFGGLVRLRVLQPGWRLAGRLVVKPLVKLVSNGR